MVATTRFLRVGIRVGIIAGLVAMSVAGLVWVALVMLSNGGQSPGPVAAPIAVDRALGGTALDGYRRANRPRPFDFPRDHGPHPDYRVEWWYLTGNLSAGPQAGAQRRFGYQLTLFRIALSPHQPRADSPWRSRQLYMGHFALTDVDSGEHHAFERFSRAAPGLEGGLEAGLAGARATPFKVWLEDWSLTGVADGPFPLRLRAADGDIAIDLTLTPLKPLVLQGDQGLSRKSAEPGNASYYYSVTRLATHGSVTTPRGTFTTTGHSWFDREWSTSALGPEQTGWDWFALQLDDGRDLMFYRLRRRDGSSDAGHDYGSSGLLVAADGSTRRLANAEVELTPVGSWISPISGDHYPASWRLRVPSAQLDLRITPLIQDQEMRLSVHYWEGAVAVTGSASGTPIGGHGFLEMTRPEPPPRP